MDGINTVLDELNVIMDKATGGDIEFIDCLVRLRSKKQRLTEAVDFIKAFEEEYFSEISTSIMDNDFYYRGKKIEVRNGGASFIYSHIPEISIKEAELSSLKEKYKSYYNVVQKGGKVATEDGEEVVMPEIKYRKSSIIVK